MLAKTSALAGAVLAASSLVSATPTVYLAGDSTMAPNGDGAGTGTDGWGQYLAQYLTIPVVNEAIAGRSYRSYTREGRFTTIAGLVQSGDFVVAEFGHNDGGSLTPTDNGRSDCPGAGDETCISVYDGVTETVLTYPTYEIDAAQLMQSKGATFVMSSPTPDNPWETGVFVQGAESRFTTYSRASAAATGAQYFNHEWYTYEFFESLGLTTVDSYYPIDHTHTSPTGANVVAQAFVRAMVCNGGGAGLAAYVNAAGKAIAGTCDSSP